jgi:hypothetical protein
MNHPTTPLASGQINSHDHLSVELVEPDSKPAMVRITWQVKATVCTPAQFDQVAATAMRLLANSVVTLAAIRARRKL